MNYQDIQHAAYDANMQLPALGLVLFTFGNVSVVDRKLGRVCHQAKRCSV
jgi:L-ribulose-5-phosphate 4-epimerase